MAAVNLIGSYNYALVALSVLIAIFASYAALDLAGRVTAARGWTRAVWLLGGAGAMGTGIWSMHYIGMLAFILPIPVAYHWPTVLLSLFAAILASVIALYVVSRQKMGASRAIAGSVLMGAGISSMHYIGMAAMRLPAICQFNSFLVVLSVVFAVLISLAALWITFHFRDEKTGIGREKLAGAVVMGAAIPVMHYTGMAAASFTPSGMSADLSHAVSISALGTAGIAAVTFIVLGLALLTSWVDRRFAVRILELQEKKLQRSEAYLAEAQRLSHTGSFGWRVAAGEIIWSEETFRIFQYDRTTKPTVELLLQRVHPDDEALVKQTIERASQDGKNFEHEYRLLMPDSSVKYVRVVAHALSDESGSVEFVGAVMDVTVARRAEESLQESEAYLAEAQRLSHTGSWAWAPRTGELRYWSEECYRVLGFDPHGGQPRFETFFQRIHPDDQARVKETSETAAREKVGFEKDYRIIHPGGEIRDIHTVGRPVFSPSGDLVEFVGAVMDVTERTRAVALRDGESHILEMIARDAPLEETLENLVRFVEAQFAGLLCSVLLLDEDGQHVRHGAAPSLPKPYSEAIDGLRIGPKAGSCGTAMYRRETVVVTDILQDPLWEAYRDVAGRYGLRACWSTPILSHSGTALGSFAMYYREPRSPSPAETRALELATHLAGIAIERKLAREERERLRQAQADLAHINRVTTMGELTASLAHEIKQPITAAFIDAKTCLRWLARDEPEVPAAREAASRLVTDVTRAADIISRISSLFKKGALQHEFVDLNELIQEMIVLLRSEAARYSILIRSELAEGLPNIMAERVQLQQVFMNLMLNGIDAMKDIGTAGELTIKSQQLKEGQLLVSVCDTGIGLPQQEAEQMFSAFFSTKAHGTGMGLPISRSIIESHGGRLWATSNSGRGASFHFTLPSKGESHTTSAQGDVPQSA
jgi:PAS domain S-box-containing protein